MTAHRRLFVWIGALTLLLVPALAGASPYGDTDSDTVQKPASAEKAKQGKAAEGSEEKKDGEKAEGEEKDSEKAEGQEKDGEKAEGEQPEGAEKDKVGTFEDIWGPGFLVEGAENLFVVLAAGSDS